MKKYILRIKLNSDTLFGSGEGLGASIDQDILIDDLGLPFISGRRIKGLIKNSAEEILEMLSCCGVQQSLKIINDNLTTESIFGKPGQIESSNIFISNFYLKDYDKIREWLQYLQPNYANIFSKEITTNQFTSIRFQIQVDEGITKEHSLRTFRILNKGFEFEGTIEIDGDENVINLIALACSNLRNSGMMRNRGFGEITVNLFDITGVNLTEEALKSLEVLCLN